MDFSASYWWLEFWTFFVLSTVSVSSLSPRGHLAERTSHPATAASSSCCCCIWEVHPYHLLSALLESLSSISFAKRGSDRFRKMFSCSAVEEKLFRWCSIMNATSLACLNIKVVSSRSRPAWLFASEVLRFSREGEKPKLLPPSVSSRIKRLRPGWMCRAADSTEDCWAHNPFTDSLSILQVM